MEPETAAAQLIYRYCRALDRLDLPLLGEVFWPDAEIALGELFRGPPPAFAELVQAFMGSMAATRHAVTNVLVTGAGERRGIESYVDAWHRLEPPEGTRVLTVAARYLSEATCRDGVWRLQRHAEVMDWAEERGADPAWFENNRELPKGRRDRDDPSYAFL